MTRALMFSFALLLALANISCIDYTGRIRSAEIKGSDLWITAELGAAGSQVDQVILISGPWKSQRSRVFRDAEKGRGTYTESGGYASFEDFLRPELTVLYRSDIRPDVETPHEDRFGIPLSAIPTGGKDELWVLGLRNGWPLDAIRIDQMLRTHASQPVQGQASQ